MKKIALIAALLVSTITAASAGPSSDAPNNAENAYFERTSNAGGG
jgi:hypothetical protein